MCNPLTDCLQHCSAVQQSPSCLWLACIQGPGGESEEEKNVTNKEEKSYSEEPKFDINSLYHTEEKTEPDFDDDHGKMLYIRLLKN